MKNKNIEKKRHLNLTQFKDYSYLILFFISFSFFTFFVIRPNLITIFSLQEELGKLQILDQGYDNVIQKIITIQTFLESSRSDLFLLDEALPNIPGINKVVDDIQNSASQSAIVLTSMGIGKIDLKDTTASKKRKPIAIHMTASGKFPEAKEFVLNVLNARRLEAINQIVFDVDGKDGTQSGLLRMTLELESYHL